VSELVDPFPGCGRFLQWSSKVWADVSDDSCSEPPRASHDPATDTWHVGPNTRERDPSSGVPPGDGSAPTSPQEPSSDVACTLMPSRQAEGAALGSLLALAALLIQRRLRR
jgi:hypothetical protein